MKRLFRWASHLSALLSAVLLVATCVLWVRSYRLADCVKLQWVNGTSTRWEPDRVFSGRGEVSLTRDTCTWTRSGAAAEFIARM